MNCWIVLDDSGSLTSYNERIRRIHGELRGELECSFDVTSWTTSSSYGMGPLSARPIGAGGGDGLERMFEALRANPAPPPQFIVYLTDGEANLNVETVRAIKQYQVMLVDILESRWEQRNISQALVDVDNFLLHECDEDCCECNPNYPCECDTDRNSCLASFGSGSQPFYPNWARQVGYSEADQKALTDRYLFRSGATPAEWTNSVAEAMHKMSTQGHIAYLDEVNLLQSRPEDIVGPFRHPVDTDLDNIVHTLNANESRDISIRAQVGVELYRKVKNIIGGNTLTSNQWAYIKNVYYRILVECINVPHEAAQKAARNLNATDTTTTEVQEGHSMSAQITTTVSLKTSSSTRATLADLKTLITEVERVGGTNESFVDFETHRRTGCLDAVVVTAVEVTEPTLDPRVECVLSIPDDEKRTHALIDLLIDFPRLRAQITPHLVKTEKPAKTTTAAKPKKA